MFRRNTSISILAIGVCMMCSAGAIADMHTFEPSPVDLWDLDHHRYATWGFEWELPAGEHIVSAKLEIDNINNWRIENNDILYIHLLDNPPLGTVNHWDGQGYGDAFDGQGPLLTTFTDDNEIGQYNPAEDFEYIFTENQRLDLVSFLEDGLVGFGFDADCHYWNDGVTFSIETAEVVPAPGAALLGVLGLGLVARMRKNRK